jgi:hypothetical protein
MLSSDGKRWKWFRTSEDFVFWPGFTALRTETRLYCIPNLISENTPHGPQ